MGTNEKFARGLRGYRAAAGMTQSELAEAVGTTAKSVSNWERGEGITLENAKAAADALGVSVEDVLDGFPEKA